MRISQLLRAVFSVIAVLAPAGAFAHSYGPPPHYVAAPGETIRACTGCHSSSSLNSGTGSVQILLAGGAFYIPGVKQRFTVQVSDPNQQRWGFELSARPNSDLQNGQAGDFAPIDNLTQVICEDYAPRPCATPMTFITHTSSGTRRGQRDGATFVFDWTPPATNVGPVTLYAAGNAANGDGNFTGDLIYTTRMELQPLTPSAPSVQTGAVVSAATSVAGPFGPNCWGTIYGTNLGVTTRSWTDTDFDNGGIPFSLDGVSVAVNQFGAPRLVYIGYVSPTQVNFLLPTDLTISGATTIQVRNSAGTSTPVPITLQANAPQLFTSDGKSVRGLHADGTALGKTPVSPGESIVIYGTGLGATSPAQTPGQVPPAPAALATLPQVMVGASAATVSSATIVPGSPGMYQIALKVPSDALGGDQPVVVQVGNGTSAATTILTIQK